MLQRAKSTVRPEDLWEICGVAEEGGVEQDIVMFFLCAIESEFHEFALFKFVGGNSGIMSSNSWNYLHTPN